MTSDLAQSDDRMLSFEEWCQLSGFSRSTGQRLLRNGKGPHFVKISARRIGVAFGEHRRWLASLPR